MAQEKSGDLPKKLIAQLGKRSDKDLASEFRTSVYLVRKERLKRKISGFQTVDWSPKWIRQLGRMTDASLADRMGITDTSVFVKRRSLGIPSFFPGREAQAKWKATQLRRLGKVPDAILAAEIGVSPSVVQAKRQSLGI